MTPTKLVSVVIAIVFETPVSLPANHVDFKPPSLCLSYRTFSSFCERACELGRHFLGQFLSSAKLRFKEGKSERARQMVSLDIPLGRPRERVRQQQQPRCTFSKIVQCLSDIVTTSGQGQNSHNIQ